MANIIGRIALQPAVVRPGESVRIEVFDNDDNSLDGSETRVSINGVQGALQFLQFPTVGQRRLVVHARAVDGETDRRVALLDVKGAPQEFLSISNRTEITMLGVTQLSTQPYTAVITLGSSIDTRFLHLLPVGSSVSPQPGKPFRHDSLAARLGTRGVLGRAMSENPEALTLKVKSFRTQSTMQAIPFAPSARTPSALSTTTNSR